MMYRMRRFSLPTRVLATVLVTAMLLAVGHISPVSVSAGRAELEAKLEKLEKQEQQIKNNLANANSNLSASQQRKNLLDSQIDNVKEQLTLLDSRLSSVNADIAATEAAIKQAQKDIANNEAAIEQTHEELGQRLRTIAKTGNTSALQRLLNTDNYTDYLLKSKAAECIARRDQQIMDELEKTLEKIRQQKVDLEKKKTTLAVNQAEILELKKTSDSKKRQLDTLYSAAQTEVNKLQNTVSSYSDQLKKKQAEIEAADAAIRELITGTGTSGKYNQNMMYWPVPTVRAISSKFGPRWGTKHKGIDVANGPIPIYGENIVAAADGTVIAVNKTSSWGYDWSAGYGYCLIIDHGKDSRGRIVSTMYAHCSKVFAYVGQKVKGGKTVIAQAGATGNVTGPHLHFEVRLNGVQVDPLDVYVSPRVN